MNLALWNRVVLGVEKEKEHVRHRRHKKQLLHRLKEEQTGVDPL
jgi:hypothetical protein